MANLNVPQAPLYQAWHVLGQGIKNQEIRLNIASQNYSNANSTSVNPGGDPYRRKTLIFKAQVDSKTGAHVPVLKKSTYDYSEFPLRFNPGHPSADTVTGYVKMPNVKTSMEALDAQDANLAFAGCSQVYSMATTMIYRLHNMINQRSA